MSQFFKCITLLLLLIHSQSLETTSSTVGATSRVHVRPAEVEFHAERLIEPFEGAKLLPKPEPGSKNVPPLGKVKLINTPAIGWDCLPFFPASFNVYTRDGSLKDITMKELGNTQYLHNVHLPDGQVITRQYHFNLTLLVAPLNPFKANRRTVMVIPGYLSGSHIQWMEDIREKWLALEDANVILVYWPRGNDNNYDYAVGNTKIVSRQITIFLYYLAQLHNDGPPFESIKFRESLQIVGHSLGAHVAGFVGQDLKGQVGRITALDPAGPLFDRFNENNRIDPKDALLVDVLHTNAGHMSYIKLGYGFLKKVADGLMEKLKKQPNGGSSVVSILQSFSSPDDTAWFGLDLASGHLDYYANGGSVQPGCNDRLHICDHSRASSIYINALEYELRIRQEFGAKQSAKLSRRLIAFPALDYNHFRSGQAFQRNCPRLVNLTDIESVTELECEEEFRRCSLPMDFVAYGSELRQELERDYGLDFGDSSSKFIERKAYFETLSEEPYVSEHYLLRIHLHRDAPIRWTRDCSLAALIHSRDQETLYSLLQYTSTSLNPMDFNSFYGLSLPYANPIDWRKPNHLPENIIEQLEASNRLETGSGGRYRQALRYFAPGRISLKVSHKDTLMGRMRGIFNRTKDEQCQLDIDEFETRPLTGTNISVYYKLRDRGKTIGENNGITAIVATANDSFHQFGNLLSLNSKQPYITVQPKIINVEKI